MKRLFLAAVAAFLLFASDALGAPALVQDIVAFSYQPTTYAATLANAVGAGDLVVVSVYWGYATSGSSVTKVQDDKGNTLTPVDSSYDSTGLINVATFYEFNVTSGPKTFTATLSAQAAGGSGIVVEEYSGIATTLPLDGHAIANVNTSGALTASTGNFTTTANGDLVWGFGWFTNGTPGPTHGTGFTASSDDTTLDALAEYLVQTTASASTTANFNLAASYNYDIVAGMAFKAAGGSGPVYHGLLTTGVGN
jgi:hypothetical protein